MWYIIKQISYLVFGYIIILTTCTVIVNQIRRNVAEKEAILAESIKPECHPIITSLDGKVILEYPCTNTKEDL